MLVSFYPFQTLEHFVADDFQGAFCRMAVGKNGAPDRMGMKDAAGIPGARDGDVEESFRGRNTVAVLHAGTLVDLKKMGGGKGRLVEAGGSDEQTHGLASQNRAEIAARSESQRTRMEFGANFRQFGCQPRGRRVADCL